MPIGAIIAGVVTAISAISGSLKIYSFLDEQFGPNNGADVVAIAFKVALDGSLGELLPDPLRQAGGNIPDIRVFNEHGERLGETINDKKKCESGQDNCVSGVKGVKQQPTYALFSGNNDAICLAWIGVTYPGKDRYAWVGNWGEQCGAPWYYSDIYVQTSDGSEKVKCTWLDGNGDQPTTGLQVHWPEYREGAAAIDSDPNYYCNNSPVLHFYYEGDPVNIFYWGPRGEVLNSDPNYKPPAPARRALGMGHSPTGNTADQKDAYIKRMRRSMSKDKRLIKSQAVDHAASELCNSPSSVGPSFVSVTERMYCHMPSKTLYPWCDDVESGACWEDETDTVIWKGEPLAGVKREALPESDFSHVVTWGTD